MRIRPPSKPKIDEVLTQLCANTPKGETLTLDQIAAACQCTRNNIWQIEQRALRKARAFFARKNMIATDFLED